MPTETHDLTASEVMVTFKCASCGETSQFPLKHTVTHKTKDDGVTLTIGHETQARPTDYGLHEFTYGLSCPVAENSSEEAHVICGSCAAGLVADVEALLSHHNGNGEP